MRKRLFWYSPVMGEHRGYETPDVIGTVVIGADSRPVVAQGNDVARRLIDDSDVLSPLAKVEAKGNGYRLNDGKCDPWGRLWVGSIVEQGAKRIGRASTA